MRQAERVIGAAKPAGFGGSKAFAMITLVDPSIPIWVRTNDVPVLTSSLVTSRRRARVAEKLLQTHQSGGSTQKGPTSEVVHTVLAIAEIMEVCEAENHVALVSHDIAPCVS